MPTGILLFSSRVILFCSYSYLTVFTGRDGPAVHRSAAHGGHQRKRVGGTVSGGLWSHRRPGQKWNAH